jgi:hypothetical protein
MLPTSVISLGVKNEGFLILSFLPHLLDDFSLDKEN